MATPSAPVISNAPLASPNTLEYWWYPPTSDGGASINDYYLTLTSQYGVLSCNVGSPGTYYKATGLSNATTYFTTIAASNANGLGATASFREFQPGSPPPRGVSTTTATAVVTSPSAALVSWTPPIGYPPVPAATIFWYVINGYTTTNSLTPVLKYTAGGQSQSNLFITGLNSTIQYYFTVRAVNCPGWSVPVSTNTITFITSVAFAPTMLNGLGIWYDATDPLGTGTVPANGTSINTWTDKSVNINNATAGVAATYTVSSIGNYLNFNGTSTYYNIGSGAFMANQYNTVFVVERLQLNSGNSMTIVSGSSSATGNNLLIRYNGTSQHQYAFYNVGNLIVSGLTYSGATQPTRVWSYSQNPSSGAMFLNGTSVVTNTNNTLLSSWPGASIGRDSEAGGRFYGGELREMIFYTGIITPYQRQKVEGYLSWKWGLQTQLPTTHPFRSAAPQSNSVFAPPMLSSLQLWLDGSDPLGTGTAPANGTSITTWVDKSGTGNNGTLTSGGVPVYQSTTNSVYFSTVIGTYSTNYSASLSNEALFYVFKGDFSAGGIPGFATSAGNGGRTLGGGNTTNSFGASAFSVGWASVTATNTLTTNTLTLGEYTNSNTTTIVYLNGGSVTGTTVVTNYTAGRTTTLTGSYANVYEVLGFSRALSTQDRQTVEGYLAWKWGLQGNLPTTHPYRYNNPAIVNFTQISPTSFSGLGLWLDASQLTGLTNGGALTTWVDRSTNAFSGTAISGPTYITNSVNGLPVVRFNGTSQYINFGNVLNIGTNTGIAVFSVVKINSTSGGIVGKAVYGPGDARWSLYRDTSVSRFFINAGSDATESTFNDSSTVVQLMEGVWNRQTQIIYQNGSQQASVTKASSATLTNTFPLWVGAYPNSTASGVQFYLNGDIGETIVYMSNITPFIRAQIEGYLTWKWGLQASLPTSHPYFTAPPQQAYTTFNPLLLPNLQLWLDASDASTFTFSSGTNISVWADKSGRANNATLTSGTVRRSTDGSRTTVDTTATGYLTTTVSSTYTNTLTICVMVLRTTSTAGQMAMAAGYPRVTYNYGSSTYLVQGGPSPSGADDGGQLGGNSYNVNGSRNALGTNTLNNYHVLSFTFSQGIGTIGTTLTIGAYGGGGSQFFGYIAEIIVFNPNTNSGTPYTDQRQTVEGYLAWKWGLQSLLPATHPYASVNPGA